MSWSVKRWRSQGGPISIGNLVEDTIAEKVFGVVVTRPEDFEEHWHSTWFCNICGKGITNYAYKETRKHDKKVHGLPRDERAQVTETKDYASYQEFTAEILGRRPSAGR
jgi:hypothetical protein